MWSMPVPNFQTFGLYRNGKGLFICISFDICFTLRKCKKKAWSFIIIALIISVMEQNIERKREICKERNGTPLITHTNDKEIQKES